MLLLGLDFESTGLNLLTAGVTEVGMVMWDTDFKQPVQALGFLVNPPPEAVWEPGVEEINGITRNICEQYGYPNEKAIRQVLFSVGNADVIVAHNGNEFDLPLLREWTLKNGHELPEKVWIDTSRDIELSTGNSFKLAYMAADHKFLNPFPHRALFDVMTMMTVLSNYDIEEVMKFAKSPTILLQALVRFDNRDLAKKRGFHWEADRKRWVKSIKEINLEKEKTAATFPIQIINSN